MIYGTGLKPRKRLLLTCLAGLLLTSCSTSAPTLAPSSDVAVATVSGEAHDRYCAGLIPQPLTEAQEANQALLEYAAAETAKWLAMGCTLPK